MRLCLLVEAASGGTGRHVIDLTRALCARGHDVTLIYSPIRSDIGFRRAASESGALVLLMPMERGIGWHDLAAARTLTRLIEHCGPFEIIHAHSSKAGAVARLAAVGGAALVYTPHALATLDPDRGMASRSMIGLAERLLGPRTDALITVSVEEWEEAGRLGISADRRHLIANRLQPASFRSRSKARAALGADRGEIWLGFAGRLSPQKAPLLFVAAALGAMRRDDRVRALILGDGEQAGLVAEAIAESDFAARFTWHRDEDARDWLAALDLYVMTSRFEGLPYVLLEALAVGVPVLTNPVGGARQLLSSGSGLVASDEALPALLLALIADSTWLARLRNQARRVGSESAGHRMIDRTEALYERLAGRA